MSLLARLAAVRGAGIRVIARLPAGDVDKEVDEELHAFAAGAESLGYVAVDAHKVIAHEERRRLCHRHVALIHRGPPTEASVRWVRDLASVSPRAHAVVSVAALADRVHEGAHALGVLERPVAHTPNMLLTRGERLLHRRRKASATRWMAAAVERCRRCGDESGAVLSFARLIKCVNAWSVDDAAPLLSRGSRLLLSVEQLSARSVVVAELADLWIAIGEFEVAAAALAAIDVECELVGLAVPEWIRVRQCELACWHGCWDLAEQYARESGRLEWHALIAYARRDWPTARAIGEVEGPLRWRDTLTLERLRMAGSDTLAADFIAQVNARPRGRAEHLLWNWCTCADELGRAPLHMEIRRLDAMGIRRWGLGRQDMHMWAGVSSLLTQVHEADDAMTAMWRGCRWAREYTGVDAVGIVSTDAAVIASDPGDLREVDVTTGQCEPLRYGGVRIGDVVFSGVGRDQSEARVVARALATACAPALRVRLDDLQLARAGDTLAGELLGISSAMRALRDNVARAAGSSFPVLIEGESGTGKELVARAVHRLSARRDRRWAAVNCAALTDELLEAELFGHTRGAFTGAVGARVGLLEDAHEGTLFLDEVAELSPRAQAKLLRVLQEGEIRRVGENMARCVDVRLVTATNRSLADAARQGTYREDLIFRLAVIRLKVPPLRDRIEDVGLLAHHFWRTLAARTSTRAFLGPDAIAALCRAPWPGNVRELQNVIASLVVGGPSAGRISARQVAEVLGERALGGNGDWSAPTSLARARLQCDRRTVAASLARHANQRAAAARELGVSRQGLVKLIARLNLEDRSEAAQPNPK